MNVKAGQIWQFMGTPYVLCSDIFGDEGKAKIRVAAKWHKQLKNENGLLRSPDWFGFMDLNNGKPRYPTQWKFIQEQKIEKVYRGQIYFLPGLLKFIEVVEIDGQLVRCISEGNLTSTWRVSQIINFPIIYNPPRNKCVGCRGV